MAAAPGSPDVVDAVAVQAEAVGAVGALHQQLDVLADAAGRAAAVDTGPDPVPVSVSPPKALAPIPVLSPGPGAPTPVPPGTLPVPPPQ